MARLTRLAIVLILSLIPGGAARASPHAGRHRSVRLIMGPVRLVTPSFGYAVAYRTVQGGTTAETAIRLFVYDRGRWRDRTPPMLQRNGINAIDDVAFLDRQHGWVAAYNCANVAVYLYRTSDAGRSWQSLGKPTSHSCGGGPTYLSFVDDRRGWMEPVSPNGPVGELLETSDGGRSWKHVVSGPPNQVRGPALPCLAPIRFVSHSIGWMGRCVLGGVYSTLDGGRRWRRARIEMPDAPDARFDVPWFSGSDGVIAATIGTRPASQSGRTIALVFALTRDGGRTWSVRSRRAIGSCPLPAYFTNVWPASVADKRVWWIVAGGGNPTAQVTMDAGSTWRTSAARGLPKRWCSVKSVSAAGPRTAWVVASVSKDSTALFGTVDAGSSWRRISLFPS